MRAFRRKLGMTDEEFRALEEAEAIRAAKIAGTTQARVVQEVITALDRAIEHGTTLEDFKAAVGQQLAEAWHGEDPPRVETIFRTTVMGAYNAGRHEILTDPDIKKRNPYVRFDTAGDSRVSDICGALDGKVLPIDDPFVRSHWPPLHPNCRSQWNPLTEEEAEAEGITEGRPDTGGAAPAEGFGKVPDPENWDPDLSVFDSDIRKILKGRIE